MGRSFWLHLRRSIFRVVPSCLTQVQAVAFNMFLTFFPVLLLGLGIFTSFEWTREAVRELPMGLQEILPPGSGLLVSQFIQHLDPHPWKLILLGVGGTLIVGTQVMIGLMAGFRLAAGDDARPAVLDRYSRALLLLCLTILPWLATVVLTVFGKQMRTWLIRQVGMRALVRFVWTLLYYSATLSVAVLVLVVVYRVARPLSRQWNDVVPGAILATALWWILNAGFGFYVRHMPYSLVYGSLAAVIGLMVWMYFTALVLMIGAAFNAELAAAAGQGTASRGSSTTVIGSVGAGRVARAGGR